MKDTEKRGEANLFFKERWVGIDIKWGEKRKRGLTPLLSQFLPKTG